MPEYLESIDAKDIQDVYKARFAELDRFESMARSVHAKAIEQAKGDQDEGNEDLRKTRLVLKRIARNAARICAGKRSEDVV